MESIRTVFFTLLGALAVTTLEAQQIPYVTNVRAESTNILRGTLVNPLPVPLSAWSVDAVDATGRAHLTQTADALLMPAKYIAAKGTLEIEIVTEDAGSRKLVFNAAISAGGMEVGDPERAFQILDARLRRVAALETVLDFLQALDPGTPGQGLYEDLKGILNVGDEGVLLDLRAKASSGPISAWIAAATEFRDKTQTGAVRHGVLRQRLTRD